MIKTGKGVSQPAADRGHRNQNLLGSMKELVEFSESTEPSDGSISTEMAEAIEQRLERQSRLIQPDR